MAKSSVAIIVLNWNDADLLPHSVGSLLSQTKKCDVIVVDNGSSDKSNKIIRSFGKKVTPIWNQFNLGFAGGINAGLRYALDEGYKYIGMLNNDAVANKNWVAELTADLDKNKGIGGVTGSIHKKGKDVYDSTGELFTIWGLAYPRGRGEKIKHQYDNKSDITAMSGGANLFRREFFEDIGLFDEDFFAYYEDVDLCLRGQNRGWKFHFCPKAVVEHKTGSTSSRVKGFTTMQTFKNTPWVLVKNVPAKLLVNMLPRFAFVYIGFVVSAASRHQLRYALKGFLGMLGKLPKKLLERHRIQSRRSVTSIQFSDLLIHDLPPNAHKLRKLRSIIRKS